MKLFKFFVLGISLLQLLTVQCQFANAGSLINRQSVPVRSKTLSIDFDKLRNRWYMFLTGNGFPSNANIHPQITAITNAANGYWKSAIKRDFSQTFIWTDLSFLASSDITGSYRRLELMSLAYCTKGSELYQNQQLKTDIIEALDWLYYHHYNERINIPSTGGINNWWDYRIGIPAELNNIIILLYNELTPAQRQNYIKAIDHTTPELKKYTGANLIWVCRVSTLSGIISKDKRKIKNAVEAIPEVFNNVTKGDGFYADGSFIQHNKHPYTGGYGASLLTSLTELFYLFSAQPAIQITLSETVFNWINDAFEPVIYKGGLMSMVMGREISRITTTEHTKGRTVVENMILLSQIVPAAQAIKLKSMVKYYVLNDHTFTNYVGQLSGIVFVKILKTIMEDKYIKPISNYQIYKQFANMDRIVQHTPAYAFGISMHSSRIFNYESINQENLKAWHTSDGMTYLYNSDQQQYNNNFWSTVNYNHLPGTTVVENSTAKPNKTSRENWVGGAVIYGKYGVTGMYLALDSTTLTARKSWFMFDNEVVALGSAIVNNDGRSVHTYIDQHKLTKNNTNIFTVNGKVIPVAQGDSNAIQTNVTWAHISGNVKGADVGYYFPQSTLLNITRHVQTGRWSDVNKFNCTDSTLNSENYITLWKDHGKLNLHADSGQYAYVILPGFSAEQVNKYVARPDIKILRNSAAVQAVLEKKLNLIAANFWTDSLTTVSVGKNINYITCNKKASLLVAETAEKIIIALADPTMLNTGTVEVVIRYSGLLKVLSQDKEITVKQLSPIIQLSFNVKDLEGRTTAITLSKKH